MQRFKLLVGMLLSLLIAIGSACASKTIVGPEGEGEYQIPEKPAVASEPVHDGSEATAISPSDNATIDDDGSAVK